jgi:hypothetical protein
MNLFGEKPDKYILMLFIAFQGLLCYNFYKREIAWYPPSNFDQADYLMVAYRTQERILTSGFGQLLRAVGGDYSTGLVLPVVGALSGLVVGSARLPQLLLNFVGYCVLQFVAFRTARVVWGSRAYAYMLLGLILCQTTPWYWAAGLFEFRYDFIAYCIYGIWVCAAIRSKLFLDRRWAIACGAIGAFLVLNRFFTIVYLLGVAVGFAGFCAVMGYVWRADSELARRMRGRLYNLALSVAVLVGIVAPFFIRSWESIFAYYGVGHVLGKNVESVRAFLEGIDTLAQHLLWYPNSILQDQWGPIFILGSAIALVGSVIARFLRPRARARANMKPSDRDETFLLQIIFLFGAILGPIAVLTLDADKSSVVGGIVGVPAALLVVVLASRIAPLREPGRSPAHKLVIACSLTIFALGLASEIDHLSQHLPEYTQRRDLQRLVELDKWLVNYASERGWRDPAISFDVISQWLWATAITDTGYEQTGKFIEFHAKFGEDIMGSGREEALSLLAQSDFLILTSQGKTGLDSGESSPRVSNDAVQQFPNMLSRLNPFSKQTVQLAPCGIPLEYSSSAIQRYPRLQFHSGVPFYEHISHYWNDLKSWADKNMILAKTVPFDNFTVTVYVRQTQPASRLARTDAKVY